VPVINFPYSCDLNAIFGFCNEIEQYCEENEVVIDFSNMSRIEPFAMVYVAKYIREFNRRNKNTVVSCRGHQTKDYAANMAFFRAFGLRHGREPNCVDGNDRFVPYTILRIQTIVDEATKEWEVEQEIIERRSAHLAEILAQQNTGNLVDALTFSIREIMRNIYEHSKSKSIEYCAQYWPYYSKVEIAIVDHGIGLKVSLKNNPHVQIATHSDAIQQALMPAISSKNYKGAIIDTNDPWHNSGFGLYMINRICRLGGSFLICSGDHGIKLDENGKEHINLPHLCRGTAVRMVLNTDKLAELNSMLAKFRNDGYEIAKQIKGVGMYEASAASQMLSRDFENNA
jgi:anti-sigma regulatory factor (Ser/Thr protein kinase)